MSEKLDMKSMDITSENIAKIRALFPSAVTEVMGDDGKVKLAIDFDALKQELSADLISDKQERYQMTWPDKSKAKLLASSQITATLRPDKEKSVNFDNTKNLYIEGDNLDVLKLLRETYLGKVKMIYIDPPYNTGNDFVYEDDFAMSAEDYAEVSGQYDEQGNRLVKNLDSNGRFHTDWLNMIYPRLKVARDLLADDGVIFISMDHHEVLNLSKVCDEVFGLNNRLGILSVINNLKGRSDDKFFATCNEFLLVYAKNRNSFELGGFELEDEELDSDYDKQDKIGYYKLIGFRKTGNAWKREERPFMFYPVLYKDGIFSTISEDEFNLIYNSSTNQFDDDYVTNLSIKYQEMGYLVAWPKAEDGSLGRWRWGRKTFFEQKDYNLELNSSGTVCTKMRATLEDGSVRVKSAKTLWYKPEYDTGSSAKILKNIMGNDSIFDNPKSLVYLKDILKISTNTNSLIMDFFGGSATTAHAVMQLNAEDGGNRRFIMVQLPEKCDEKSEAYKAGYKTICDIGEERIRRAGSKIKEEKRMQLGLPDAVTHFYDFINAKTEDEMKRVKESYAELDNLDIGFRVLKLDSSNMQEVYYNPSAMTQDLLSMIVDNVKEDRTPLDLLFQVMLDLGIELSAKIEEQSVNGKNYYIVNDNDLIACFDENIDNNVITAIAKMQPLYAVFKDKSFATDSVGINNEQLFKTYSPSTVVKVI